MRNDQRLISGMTTDGDRVVGPFFAGAYSYRGFHLRSQSAAEVHSGRSAFSAGREELLHLSPASSLLGQFW